MIAQTEQADRRGLINNAIVQRAAVALAGSPPC